MFYKSKRRKFQIQTLKIDLSSNKHVCKKENLLWIASRHFIWWGNKIWLMKNADHHIPFLLRNVREWSGSGHEWVDDHELRVYIKWLPSVTEGLTRNFDKFEKSFSCWYVHISSNTSSFRTSFREICSKKPGEINKMFNHFFNIRIPKYTDSWKIRGRHGKKKSERSDGQKSECREITRHDNRRLICSYWIARS